MSYTYLFKYIIIGDTAVGQSSIFNQFITAQYKEKHQITIGVQFGAKTVNVNGKNIKLQMWDTAGQQDFKSITRQYYRNSAGAILVYDITRRETFENIKQWLNEVKENGNNTMTLVLIGNQNDLEQKRAVSVQEATQFSKENELLFMQTSAKTNKNVDDVFQELTQCILTQIETGKVDSSEPRNGIQLGEESGQCVLNKQNTNKQKQKGGCC